MLDLAKMIHEAIGTEYPRLFMITLGVIGLILGWIVDKQYRAKIQNDQAQIASPADGRGGKGGGGNASGKGSLVLGGKGGPGGGPGGGRGGDGGGGDAVGDGSIVIGGDGGGGGGRPDGRGGIGAPSPLKKLSPEVLKSFGLTGNETYGQGGSSPNSPEYDRSLKVLNAISAEYIANNPKAKLESMPGVLMPPVSWVNKRLSERQETFRVELIDNGTDFLLRPSHEK